MEVIVSARVIAFCLTMFTVFVNKFMIYSIVVDKGLICFVPKSGWDKTFVKFLCCFVVMF